MKLRSVYLKNFILVAFAMNARIAIACPDCQEEKCAFGGCICVPRANCVIPSVTVPSIPIPTPGEIVEKAKQVAQSAEKELKKAGGAVQSEVTKLGDTVKAVEQIGTSTLATFSNKAGDAVRVLTDAQGNAVTTITKAGSDTVKTVVKAAGDATATYTKGWRDTAEQTKRSVEDAIDAGRAAARYTENQGKAVAEAVKNAERRVQQGKIVDAVWHFSTEPLQASERNFAKATQESELINQAAGSAAAIYGGPGGAAAYAAWSTYRRTGDANLAFRAGLLAAAQSQLGSATAKMPAGTAGEVLKKAAVAGAAGGIAVAAAGGDEQAIKDGFLKSAGAVIVQAGTAKATAYSPKVADAYKTVQCISARDVDCLSNTTWARDAKGKILYDAKGNPRVDTTKLDPKHLVGKWTGIDMKSADGKRATLVADIAKLPKLGAIPLLKNRWVLTSNLGKQAELPHGVPAVVLTSVGASPPFFANVEYGVDATGGNAYRCPITGFVRTIKVTTTANGCVATYYREGKTSQIIWRSEHHHDTCATKTTEFVQHLRRLGVSCVAAE